MVFVDPPYNLGKEYSRYHDDKKTIMKPIDDFILMLNKRTQETTEKFNEKSFN